jgi:hypothetical protein
MAEPSNKKFTMESFAVIGFIRRRLHHEVCMYLLLRSIIFTRSGAPTPQKT